ncbi:glycosyltransferase [Curtobacterium sp. VKM Ac-1376]|uniref:glycosyltransferase n=1 Tax=Curtobacterium sp. VKM Ac-1376 TaxID=123312 RepID=UPI00188A8469|nr:glycosyltransferase [Curtobacterium sp. VKM Ac-1376]MBF4614048.1 glycosyltransferase [Curtobacterium sp. VKM Ac-1376]
MAPRPRPFDIVHVSSAHPWTDNRVHLRAAGSAATAGYRTALIAVAAAGDAPDPDWDSPDPDTGVYVRRIPARRRSRRVLVSSVQAVCAALSSRAPIVHLHDPELLWAVPVLRCLHRTVVYDAHEDLPDQVRGKEYLGPVARRASTMAAHAALAVARGSSTVIAATPTIARRFPADRTVLVRNVPQLRAADTEAHAVTDRDRVVVYIGSMSRDRGIDVLAGVASSPALPDGWRMLTAGPIDGAVDRRAFDELVRTGRIDHRGVVRPRAARDLLVTARIGLLPLFPTPAYAASIPTKLFEYLAAGLAVVATDVPLWRELLAGTDCATWVPPGDPEAIVAAIRRYDDDPELLRNHAEAGRALVLERFRWDREEQVLLDLYRSLSGAAPVPEAVAR